MNRFKAFSTSLSAIIVVFVFVSIIDLIIAMINVRYYTSIPFIVTYGISGMFAAVFGFYYGKQMMPSVNKNETWYLIGFQVITGLSCFFIFGKLEGGDYEAAFKSFGAALALGSLLFIKDQP